MRYRSVAAASRGVSFIYSLLEHIFLTTTIMQMDLIWESIPSIRLPTFVDPSTFLSREFRSVLLVVTDLPSMIRMEPFMTLRYPPYTEEAYNSTLTAGSRAQIPAA